MSLGVLRERVSRDKRERNREGGLPVTLVTAEADSEGAISIYLSLTHGALKRSCRCSATVHLPGDRSSALPRSSLWFDFRRRFLPRRCINIFLQQVVSEPQFGSSALAPVNNLSDLRSSSDPAILLLLLLLLLRLLPCLYFFCFSACRWFLFTVSVIRLAAVFQKRKPKPVFNP
ncbi:hypothetical protein M9H77_18354 [Catharanthus roseus]|uniref:Uncharacterized protein n=1 Tax=Catharanthus roseus TaxID=4058 RepID=A0ACC0B792_CATRO|nr:hypothetical protein M9H77_18354 [Catharanthus roseus]